MNKYQEALSLLFCTSEGLSEQKVYQSKKILQELVDKETPEKYKSKADKDGRMIWVCPKCNETLVKFWSEVETVSHLPYCYMCGQKLDWSEENDENRC